MTVIHVDTLSPATRQNFKAALAKLREIGWSVRCEAERRFSVACAPNAEPRVTLLAVDQMPYPSMEAPSKLDCFNILAVLGLDDLERSLAQSVSPGHKVDRVLIGFNWVLVRSGALCGIARSPARDTEGARTIRPSEGFAGKELFELATFLISADPLSRAVGLAAVNCFWNRLDAPERTKSYLAKRGGLLSFEPPGKDVLIIGGFRGALKRLPLARIIEREPKPGDIPASDAPKAFKSTTKLAITAQTIMNASLIPLLEASELVAFRNLVGPSCPLCPMLFDYGLDELYGAVIIDPEEAETFIMESGTMIMLDHIAKSRTLRAKPETC